MTSGVYGVFDREDVCLYVGQSRDVEVRWTSHTKMLNAGSHRTLQPAFPQWKQGVRAQEVFVFRLLQECDGTDEALNAAEIHWFDTLKPLYYGQVPSMNNTWEQSADTRAKIAAGVRAHYDKIGRKPDALKYRTPVTIICRHCGKEYQTRNKGGFCSSRCANIYLNRSKYADSLGTTREEVEQSVCGLYEQGFSLRQVAKEAGVSHISVRRILIANNVPLRRTGPNNT